MLKNILTLIVIGVLLIVPLHVLAQQPENLQPAPEPREYTSAEPNTQHKLYFPFVARFCFRFSYVCGTPTATQTPVVIVVTATPTLIPTQPTETPTSQPTPTLIPTQPTETPTSQPTPTLIPTQPTETPTSEATILPYVEVTLKSCIFQSDSTLKATIVFTTYPIASNLNIAVFVDNVFAQNVVESSGSGTIELVAPEMKRIDYYFSVDSIGLGSTSINCDFTTTVTKTTIPFR